MSKIGYIRVSTVQQNTVRQLDGVELDKVFIDKCSGSTTDREELKRLKEYVREGDTVVVHDISRLARDMKDLLGLIEFFNSKSVAVQFIKESMVFSAEKNNPMNELLLNLLGSVYQFERQMLLERQAEGITKAKAAGKYKGRTATVDKQAIRDCLESGLSVRKTAKKLGVGVSTVQRSKSLSY
ncbi:recombinase family protein [Vibrio parahaemolyticus]|uniref:recombinase family protein n=1 Tax=Vibrio parahaemolyticus TaxID=670 RepID=UPI00084B8C8F|nr:recombinase family protein [Vibrio parahaemolyticus]ODW45552.1 resolvase [Vibrio parahaemolyticus]